MEVNDLLGIGQSFDKLLGVIENGVGKLYEPTHLKNIAKAKAAEIRLIEAAKTDAEIDRAKQLSKLQPDVVLNLSNVNIDLIERAKIRLARQEIERQSNIDNIVEQAVIALPNTVDNKPVERDWTNRFFQAAQDISETEMQNRWGKVLAGETTQPGRFSIRSLEVLRNLSSREASLFATVCSLVTQGNEFIIKIPDDKSGMFMVEDSEAMSKLGFTHNVFIKLVDAGLLHPESTLEMTFKVQEKPLILMNNGRHFRAEVAENNNTSQEIVFQTVNFTEAGRQLGTLVPNNFQQHYFDLLSSRYLNHGIKLSLID
jgi:uncharacterized repeat protein (TIGR03899 family)